MTTTIKAIQQQIEKIGETLKPDEDWMPVLILEDKKSTTILGILNMGNDQEKDAVAEGMRTAIVTHKPDMACFVSTAWMLKLDPDDDTELDMYRAGLLRPSTSKKRVEIVMCNCVARRGKLDGEVMMYGEILRSATGPPRIKKWEVMPPDGTTEGRFAEAMRKGFDEIEGGS